VKTALHRGASRYAPENTIPAFDRAIGLGADFIEFDVRHTLDNGLVLLHDRDLDRTTRLRGPVTEYAAAEIASVDAGTWFGRPFVGTKVPTLDEALSRMKQSRVEFYVDAKDVDPAALVDALKRHDVVDRSVVFQNAPYLARLRAIAPELRRMAPLRRVDELEDLVERVKPYAVDARWATLTNALIDQCHARNILVFSDAIGAHESIEQYQRAIVAGVDLIQTDHPLRVLRAIERLKQ
jgi:glycerophosphoryl diester phosphodiesterase